jgi:Fur family transcriptional regulator, ferric uptake regulator
LQFIFLTFEGMKKASQLLEELGFRKTQIRLKVLEYLQKSEKAVSQPELEKKFNSLADRVTLYRILSAFEEKGIIHKIMDLQGVARYAMCNEKHCSEHEHHDEHVHFNCTECGDVVCLDTVKVPSIKLPKDFSLSRLNLNIEGTCDNCKK